MVGTELNSFSDPIFFSGPNFFLDLKLFSDQNFLLGQQIFSDILSPRLYFVSLVDMSNYRPTVTFLLVNFGEGSSSSCSCWDRGKTKSTPSPRPKTGV